MKRKLKNLFIVLLLAAISSAIIYAWQALPIISGYGAKNLCTCVFVAGRSVESVLDNELGSMPLSLGSFTVNRDDQSASGDVFGLAGKKAIYREGLGCTLLAEITEAEVRNQPIRLVPLKSIPDSITFTRVADSLAGDVIDATALEQAIDNAFVEENTEAPVRTRAVVVLHKGTLVGEHYADGFSRDTPQIGWSMTKSVTATLVGMLVKDGVLSLTDANLFPEWAEDDRRHITVDQLLRMSSGLEWEEEYSGPSSATNMLFKTADMGGFAASQDLAYAPEEVWYYSSGTSNILSKLVRMKLGDRYHNYVRERLFNPLGMSSAVIEPDASGTYVGSSYMYATPLDWAKFGQLYLNNGQWLGEQLLPADWAKYVSTPTPKAPKGQYGGHFWLNAGEKENPDNRVYPDAPADLYSANGYEGQRVFIIPSLELVVVRLGQTKVRGSFDFNNMLKEIIAAVER